MYHGLFIDGFAGGVTVYERMADPIAIEYDSGRVQPLMLGGPSNA